MALTKKELGRLQSSMEYSRKKLEPFRKNQLQAVQQMVGYHYSGIGGAEDKVPINFIELALNIYVQHLAASRPQFLVTTDSKELKPIALKLGLDINWLLKELKFEEVIQSAVTQAIFSIGIVKTGLHNTLNVQLDGQWYPLGEPFASDVSLDNWVHDMVAVKWGQIQYCGDRYTVPMDDLKSMKLDDEFIKQLVPNDFSDDMNEDGNKKTSSISKDSEMVQESFRDTVNLWDIWLPYKKKVITIAHQVDIVGKTIDWEGPVTGMYHFLKFNKVPDNIMPLAPVANWRDLHNLANGLMRKLSKQAQRQKTITGVRGGADADGERVIQANDGDMIRLDNPKDVAEFTTGGINQQTLLFLLQVKELTNYFYGNLNALGGLERQSETLGQDTLLTASASKRLESMQGKTIDFTTKVGADLGWYRWTDPVRSFPVTIRRHGTEVKTALRLRDRETDFYEYNFDIQAFSMQRQTPESKVAALMQVYERIIVPQAPILAQQGIFVNFEAFLKLIGRYTNLPELDDILIYAEPQIPQDGPHGQTSRPINTTHKSIREGRPGATSQGNDRVLQQLMAGGNVQASQAAQLTKPA